MDTFEIRNKDQRRIGTNSSTKWKPRTFVVCVIALATAGFITVLVYSFLKGYELEAEEEKLENLTSDSITDIQCEEEFCATKGCIITAARMIDIVNTEANPCNDFCEYACGNYKFGHFPRFQEDSYTPIKEAEENVIVILKKILHTSPMEGDSDSLKKARNFFSSCINTERRDSTSLDAFRQFLTSVDLSWPLLSHDWHEDETDWKTVVRRLENDYKISTIFRRHNEITDDNPFGKQIIECKVPTLPASVYVHGNGSVPYILKMYKELMDLALQSLGIDRSRRMGFIEEIVALETALARSITESSQESGEQPSREVIQILQEDAENLDHLRSDTHSKCGGNMTKLLDVLGSQSNKVLKNYLGWRTLYNVMRFLTSEMKELSDAYIGSFPGSPQVHSTTFRECSAAVKDELGLMATKVYLDAGYFPLREEAEVRELMTEMKVAFSALLHTLPWMDNDTLSVFQDKLKEMKQNFGYREDLRSGDTVDYLFRELDIKENDTYFLNVMKVREHISTLLNSDYRKHSVDANPLDTGSMYNYLNNDMDLKLGLFRSPLMLYGEDYPKFLKYGCAVPLAHEMSHAFDTLGSLFNAHGELEGTEWWPDVVKRKFTGFVGCLQQQEFLRSKIPTNETDFGDINNDIADLGSLFITYAGLSLHLRLHGDEEKPLPGFTTNKKQMYLLQAAQWFCEVRETRQTIDPYVKLPRTGKQRLNAAVANFENFGAIFDCPVGSPMNPAQKCNLLR